MFETIRLLKEENENLIDENQFILEEFARDKMHLQTSLRERDHLLYRVYRDLHAFVHGKEDQRHWNVGEILATLEEHLDHYHIAPVKQDDPDTDNDDFVTKL